ncbi:hypothetical protein BGW38_007559 [Lunasporangiospora selenospora]|uniref:Tetratricopeptide SHNi-TPR domain-containing protein n=1 Tax=Lunasporangiospora selenospora TaxID=979761 RepID=A0A9P6G2F5_9FUNG|nr:hypothetical protein BGW38_007559 [Lunasporangiospora selenospora]
MDNNQEKQLQDSSQGSSERVVDAQEAQDEAFLPTYDGPIAPETELAIQELNEAGAKAFALQDYELAIEKLALASEMLGQIYGETSPKCADTLFMYGKALLEHGIQQSSVLGGVTQNKPKQELEAIVAAAGGSSSAASSSAATNNPRFVFEGDEEDEEDEEGDEEGEEGQGEDDSDDFAVAWDVLDLARVLYHRIGTEDALLKLGDVHIALGDVSLESENFEQAVSDFQEAIKIKEARLDPDDRQLAEAHYKLALALEYTPNESEKAHEHIHQASSVLKARVQKLNGLLASGKGKARATDASESETKMAKELVELHELIGEMEQKVQDMIANQAKKASEEEDPRSTLISELLGQKTPQTVNDISNLIKPKVNKPSPAASSSGASPAAASATKASEKEDLPEERADLKRKAADNVETMENEEAEKRAKV